jgi:signal peptidase II
MLFFENNKREFFFISSIILTLLDQLSKYIIRYSGGFYICNSGISFGIKIPAPLIFLLIGIFLSVFTFLFIKKRIHHSFGLALIIGGAVSNLIDRLYLGCVIDFIDLKVWPIFNLADTFIFLGFVLLLLQNVKKDRPQ